MSLGIWAVTPQSYTRSMTAAGNRTRGKTENPDGNWSAEGRAKSVIRLAVDVGDPVQRRRVEKLFSACFQLRRAVQADARRRITVYWAAHRQRTAAGPAAMRERLGLSRAGLERAARAHLDAAPHLARWFSKALGLHLADTVWEAARRHLFADRTGKRLGKRGVTSWWDFTRIPGRARSHTTVKKWETFRLHGTRGRDQGGGAPGRLAPPPWGPHPQAGGRRHRLVGLPRTTPHLVRVREPGHRPRRVLRPEPGRSRPQPPMRHPP